MKSDPKYDVSFECMMEYSFVFWIVGAVLSSFGLIECGHRCALYQLDRTYRRRVAASSVVHVCPAALEGVPIPVWESSERVTYVKPLRITIVPV